MKSDVAFSFALGEGPALDVVRFELTEGVSQAFRLELDLSSADDAIDAAELLDREAVFTIERDGAAERTVVGICTAFEQCETGFRLTRYRAVVESPLARLALRHNSRIFQQVNAPEILATILQEHRLQGSKTTFLGHHEPREYAVQYREFDAEFLHRLATEEGIVYWHQAEGATHSRLVLTDRIDTAPTLDGEVLYQPAPAGDAPRPHLWHFAHRRQLAPTRVTQRDATFHNPRYDLQHEARPWSHDKAIGDYGCASAWVAMASTASARARWNARPVRWSRCTTARRCRRSSTRARNYQRGCGSGTTPNWDWADWACSHPPTAPTRRSRRWGVKTG
ncbi:type VI secretion system Vgr family protein [Lysobacter changpingensis]|uniref:type VI secretion system Vgr family protein n=1 Tax=Lysobacter changpingensis TaxID=2792784 RepID=UPI001A8E9486|nr:type VI secretion system tip protein VgrG [Lysobacter changpingensis]